MPVCVARALRSPGAALALLLLLPLVPGTAAAAAAPREPELQMHVYQLRHQRASEAMTMVLPLLSARGTVQVRPGDNTLVVRDTLAALQKILPVLYAFDHASRPVDVELWLVRATIAGVAPPAAPAPGKALPVDLVRSLRSSFNYQDYFLVGSSNVSAQEGERVTFQVGGDFVVRFRLGTIVGEQRLRLNDFEVLLEPERGEPVSLLKAQLNLWLARTMAMGLTAGQESGAALLVVVRCEAAKTPRVRAKGR